MNKIYDCIIIGSGPSGLAAANIFSKSNIDYMIIDQGKLLYKRNRNVPADVVSGVGGGGLYSDGKLSFYPSGSNLYKLNTLLLEKSYNYLQRILNNLSIEIPSLENLKNLRTDFSSDSVINKDYQSIILSNEELYNLGYYLYDQIKKECFLLNTKVVEIKKDKNIYNIKTFDFIDKSNDIIKTRKILFAAGKFGAYNLERYVNINYLEFKKFEFGYRFETKEKDFDFNNYTQTDLKLIFNGIDELNEEFRTFCFSRKGKVVHGNFEGINTYNGISNIINSNKLTFGLNYRIKNENNYRKYADNFKQLMNSNSIKCISINDFLSKNIHNIPTPIYKSYLSCIKKYFPKLIGSETKLYGPTFEYFGYYPKINDELKIQSENFWFAGDSTGEFRGLIPALVSGLISAYSILKKENNDKDRLYNLVRIKPSPTKKTKAIFTAQSKKFFYCKDAICEYVFNEGFIPINPFQVFGYFLNDRVERSLVRNGNNELISRCDEIWIFGPISDGVLFEIARAYELKIPIKFFTIGALAREILEISDLSQLVFEPEVYSQIGKENLIKFISKYYVEDDLKVQQLKFDFD